MAQETTDRQSKNNVFVDLFKDKKYVCQLYRELHPEEPDITVDDIEIKTLSAIIVNTLYNDLGFIVRDKIVVLVEAQSIWCPNIPLRMMFYLSETYRRYLEETSQSEHHTTKVRLPKPELHVIYSGTAKIPEEISLNEMFFGGNSPVDVRVKVFHSVDQSLCGQYVGFCREFDKQRKIHRTGIACAKETIKNCIEKGYLSTYLQEKETEVINMMSVIFNEEYARKQYDKALFADAIAKGEARGIALGNAKGMEAKTIEIASKMLRSGIASHEEIAELTGLSLEKVNELAATISEDNA